MSLYHLCFGCFDCRGGGSVRLDVVVQLTLRNGVRFRKRSVPIDIHLSFGELCLSLRQLSVRLIKQCLEGARIDLEQHLPLADKRTFFVSLLNDVSRYLGLNLRVYVAVERRHPFADDGDVLLQNRGDFHFRTRNHGRGARFSAGRSRRQGRKQKNKDDERVKRETTA